MYCSVLYTVQYSTIQYSTIVQYNSTVQYSTQYRVCVLLSTVHNTVQYNTVHSTEYVYCSDKTAAVPPMRQVLKKLVWIREEEHHHDDEEEEEEEYEE